ncbi:MAG: YqeG family HAD IIIA-type phosphatase [Clostridia bacterium]|nr:YqeG family HAD IIIA-type phosphatase [Clostridia bacterium]
MKNLKPDLIYKGVQYIELDELKKRGIEGILLDIDNTLIDYRKEVSEEIANWVKDAKKQGFKMCILSNSNKLEKITKVAKKVEMEYISFAKKPSKSGFLKAAKLLNIENNKIAMVGDQVFTDVLGANKVNMLSIYVEPINKKEYWYTKWKRPIEALILKYFESKR